MNDSMPQRHWNSIENRSDDFLVRPILLEHRDTKRFFSKGAKAYVASLFPQFSDNVNSVDMFENQNTAFCAKIGCPAGVGGCYFVKENIILICWNPKVDYNIVACHEMLHFVSRLCGSSVSSVVQEENFAFSKSIRFALDSGKSIVWVRDSYMRPFYMGMFKSMFRSTVVQNGVPVQVLGEASRKLAEQMADEHMNNLIEKELGPEAFRIQFDKLPPPKTSPEDDDTPLSYL